MKAGPGVNVAFTKKEQKLTPVDSHSHEKITVLPNTIKFSRDHTHSIRIRSLTWKKKKSLSM